ncbi:hypothetical protein [Bacillus wiedmannii]|uniref:hypothetical protein n=1 Tax=Bacillus wiedmannii TaxID=1890302 RepID=UPI002406A7DB|nr:hypothetical protein [Bacillus wiedmannii]MDF9663779.1 hypothetical protein [Bacillus wiedmannii]
MIKTDFNDSTFSGFEGGERILVDTGVILALANEYDAWHNTVRNLFEKYILDDELDEKPLFLFVNPTILNEITFLSGRPFENFKKKNPEMDFSKIDPTVIIEDTVAAIRNLIDKDVLILIDGNKESALKQLDTYKILGSADAVNASIANEFNLNFLTVDNRLVNNLHQNKHEFPNVSKAYYTIPDYRSY